MRFWTQNISAGDSITIVSAMNVLSLSFQMSAGTNDAGTFAGDWTLDKAGGDLASETIALGPGQGHTMQAPPNSPIDGLTLACTVGILRVTAGF